MAVAKLRINPLSQKETDISYEHGDTLLDILEAIRKDTNLRNIEGFEDHWIIVVNGHIVKKDLWSTIKPKPESTVLFAIMPEGGSLGQIIKQVVNTFSVYIGAAVGSFFGSSAIGSIAGLLYIPKLMNKLIPPLTVGGGIGSFSGNKFDTSQTYSISNQSNSVKKYGPVLKCYGRHRVFPLVAGNPYTQIEADPNTGELVQYFYAIYDFGFGPNVIEDLKIGSTLVTEYTDVTTRLVDLNKVTEGYWDDEVYDSFQLYKGDVAQDSVAVALNKNQEDAGAIPSEYQVTRNAAVNVSSFKQEIIVTFAFPAGLTTIDTQGVKQERTVDLKLEFAVDGTEDWRTFDDFEYVDDFDEAVSEFNNIYMPTDSWDDSPADSIALTSTEYYDPWDNTKGVPDVFMGYSEDANGIKIRNNDYSFEIEYYGVLSGLTSRIPLTSTIPVGSSLYINGNKLGTIATRTEITPTFFWYTFPVASFTESIFYRIKRTDKTGPTITYYMPDFNTMLGTGESVFKAKGFDNGVNSYSGTQQNLLFGTFRFKPKTLESIKVRLTRVRSLRQLINLTELFKT